MTVIAFRAFSRDAVAPSLSRLHRDKGGIPPRPNNMATPKPFELIAGHPALDLVNTLDHRFGPPATRENLNTWDDLLRFVTQSGLLSENKARKLKRLDSSPAERAQILAQAIALR